ncbi:MAG: hypothetical protein ACXVYV_08660 [Gaiellales bacterium]
MHSGAESIRGRFGPQAPVRPIVANLLLALGARTDLPIEQLDELGLAVDLVLAGRAAGEVAVELWARDDELAVSISPVTHEWPVRHRLVLESLVSEIEAAGDEVLLRARR